MNGSISSGLALTCFCCLCNCRCQFIGRLPIRQPLDRETCHDTCKTTRAGLDKDTPTLKCCLLQSDEHLYLHNVVHSRSRGHAKRGRVYVLVSWSPRVHAQHSPHHQTASVERAAASTAALTSLHHTNHATQACNAQGTAHRHP